MQNDVPALIKEQKILGSETIIEDLRKGLDQFYNVLGTKGLEIIESLGFDENLLHSCVTSTADKTYE